MNHLIISILPITFILNQFSFISNRKSNYLISSILGLFIISYYICLDNSELFNDSLSLWLIWLVYLILCVLLMESGDLGSGDNLLVMISWLSVITFYVDDLLFFYIAYELLLIPMVYLIGYYGSRNKKLEALYELYIYTLIGSLLLLIGFIYLILYTGSTDIFYIQTIQLDPSIQYILFFFIFFGFAIKIPLIPIHIWLPKAHVEAPTTVSIFLAAILLKLGSYGYFRFLLPLLPDALDAFHSFIYTLSIIGIIYTSLICITLIDMKKIIAYSSIGHMNICMLGLFSNSYTGLQASIYFMLSHGIISSGLFLLIGILYNRYHTRTLIYFKGLVLLYPLFSVFFILFQLGNIAFPLTSGFLSEVLTFIVIISQHPILGLFASLAIILTPIYVLIMIHNVLYGSWSPYLYPSYDLSKRELHSGLLPLVIIMFLLGIFPNILFDSLHSSILNYLY